MDYHNGAVIFFDGYCNLCSGSVRFILKRDNKKVFTFIPLQSEKALEILNVSFSDKKTFSTIILMEKRKFYHLSDAVLRITRHLSFPWNLFYGFIIVPPVIRNWIYMFFSRNRYRWFGRRDECFLI